MTELQAVISAGMEFQMDAPEKEKLVLKRSVLGFGNIIVREKRYLNKQKGCEILWRKISACPK